MVNTFIYLYISILKKLKEGLLPIYIYINSLKDNSITTYKYKHIKDKKRKTIQDWEEKQKKTWRQKEQRYNRKKIIAYVKNNEKKRHQTTL